MSMRASVCMFGCRLQLSVSGAQVSDQGKTKGRRCRAALRANSRELTAAYPICPISVNIGMYMAMTMPPMATPRKAMRTGSRSFIRPATAVSTSSS